MITTALLNKILGLDIQESFNFSALGLSNASKAESLSFLDDERYLSELNANLNISGVLVSMENKHLLASTKEIIVVEDPRWAYYSLHNYIAKNTKVQFETKIEKSTFVHKTAYVAEKNVIIGANCIIQPNATILEDVEIGDNCIIGAGTVVGCEGFEHKRTRNGILSVVHDGKVIMHNNVELGANNAVSKGFNSRLTIIGEHCKTDNLVHIAHGVQIGKRCFFPASCMIAGSVTIEDDVWIGPNSSISSFIEIKKNAFVTIGSVVTRNVNEGAKVTGNFAIAHDMFLSNLKSIINK
jgi:UDP-3-O-[3-hydroxymyristoyl] glucosamine N-acyltransferase LpxD